MNGGSVRGNSSEPSNMLTVPPELRSSNNNRVLESVKSHSSNYQHAPVIRSSS